MAVAIAIFRSRERSERYDLRLSLDHLSALAKKGEIKMKSMNLFGDIKSKKKTYTEDLKKKAVKLSSKIRITKAAESLGVSTSSIYSWQKTLAKLPTPIQDENGNLTFTLEGKIYYLNINSKEERERVKAEVNTNSLAKYDWFKEETGEKHWVLYNTEMYEMIRDDVFYLHYKKDSNLAPVIPINASSCYKMFYDCTTSFNLSNFDTSKMTDMSWMFDNCKALTQLDLSNFDTSNVTNMSYMFSKCQSLTSLDLSNFDTSKVTDMSYMFSYCSRLISLDLSSFDTSNVTDMSYMFEDCSGLTLLDLSNFNTENVTNMHYMFKYCDSLTTINVSNQWNTDSVKFSIKMFKKCYSLPNFNQEKTDIKMAKSIEEGGYLTLKK